MPFIYNLIEEMENFEISCHIDSWSQNFSVKWFQIDIKNETKLLNENIIYQIDTNNTYSTLKLNKITKSMNNYKFKCIVNILAHSTYGELIKFESDKSTSLNVLCNITLYHYSFLNYFKIFCLFKKKLNL